MGSTTPVRRACVRSALTTVVVLATVPATHAAAAQEPEPPATSPPAVGALLTAGDWRRPGPSKHADPRTVLGTLGSAPVRIATVRNVGGRPVFAVRTLPPGRAVAAVRSAQADPAVLAVEVPKAVEVHVDDPTRPRQWPLNRAAAGELDLESLRRAGATGTGVTTAVVDTGLQGNHPDLVGRVLPGVEFSDDARGTRTGNHDDHGHGTHVAGIIGATTNNRTGVASPAATGRILPVKVFSAAGRGWTTDVAQGITYAADSGAKVINVSLGSSVPSDLERIAVDHAVAKGALVFAAAGNEKQEGNPTTYPAAYSGAIAVGALSDTAGHSIAPFSNTGRYVDLTAPGSRVVSTCLTSTYCDMSGTSMAAPYTASIASALWSVRPSASRSDVLTTLIATATDKGTAGRDDVYGYGAVNPVAALHRLGILTQVVAARPTLRDACGTTKDAITIPASTGVTYTLNGRAVGAGSYPASGTMTVRAAPLNRYALRIGSAASWALTPTTSTCPTTMSVPALATPNAVKAAATHRWAASSVPAGAGALRYSTQRRTVLVASDGTRSYSARSAWLTDTTATAATSAGTPGSTYQARGWAKDSTGAIGSASAWATVTMPYDDRLASTWSRGWASGSHASYYLGTYRSTTTAKAFWARGNVWTNGISLVGVKHPRGSKAQVYVDGALRATIDTYSSTTRYRQTLAFVSLPWGKHNIKLVNLATSGRPQLIVDGIAYRR